MARRPDEQQWVDIALPRTMNTGAAVWTLDDHEAPLIMNMLTHEAGQVRQRKRFTRVVSVTPLTAAGDLPFSVATSPNLAAGATNPTTVPTRALASYFINNQTGVVLPYRLAYPGGPFPTGYASLVPGDMTTVFVNADNPAAVTAAAFVSLASWFGADGPLLTPYGQMTQFDFSTFGTSAGATTGQETKTGASRTGTRLVRWAGSNRAVAGPLAATLTLGSPIVTLGAAQTPSLAGTFMNYPGNPAGIKYNYYVLSHVAGTANVVLSKPYGLGNASALAGAVNVWFLPLAIVINSPPDVQQCGSYLSRLFVGRPTVLTTVGSIQLGTYPNAVQWCDVNEPEKWTDTNIAILDNNAGDVVMGFATLRNMLVIFRRYSTWAMTGTDESSFTFQQVSSYGCLDARSITNYKDGVFFMSDTGLIYFDGYAFNDVTSPSPGHGIRSTYVADSERFVNPETYPLSIQATTIIPRSDFLIMLGQNLETASDARHTQYLYHIPSGSWTQLKTANTDQLVLFTKPGQHLNNQCLGFIGSEGLVLLDKMVEPEYMGAIGANQGRYDESYDVTTGANTSFAVQMYIEKIIRPFGGMTGRLHRVIVEHNIWKSTATTINGPNVAVGTDPYFGDVLGTGQSFVVGNITPRYQPTELFSTYQYRYSTDFIGTTWPLEGTMFWFWIDTTEVSLDANNASHPPKIFNLRALFQHTGRATVDNAITS